MRAAFHNFLKELAERDKDIVLLTGDLGYSFNEEFAKELPELEKTMKEERRKMAQEDKKK